MSNWKLLSKTVSETHNRIGVSVVNKEGDPITEGQLVNLTTDNDKFTKSGGDLKPKEIRKWLWTYRKNRSFSRSNLVVWSSYNEEDDTTYMGVGAVVPTRTASKFSEDRKVEL